MHIPSVSWPPRLLLALSVLMNISVVFAETRNADPSNYRTVLSSLTPGDTMVLAPGTYSQGLPLSGMNGTAAEPIVIRGPEDQSAVFVARSCCNTVQLGNTSHVQILNLTLDGAGLDDPFGVDSNAPTHHILVEGLRIINHGAHQQIVGISTKAPAWNWVIRRNTIIGAGTGIYLGNSDGSQPFVAGIIEHNLIIDSLGYNMQIKHQQPRPSGIGLPTGMSRTIIRHNVFTKSGNSSTGELARPNLLVGHFPLSGTGASDRYEIYGNFFYRNPTEALFQGEGNIALHDNLFVTTSGTAINIQPHQGEVRDVSIYHNTVVASGTGIRVSGAATGYTQRIVGNASFATTPISGPGQQNNVTGTYSAAANELNAPHAAIGSLDLFPKSGRLTGTPIDLSGFAHFADGTEDFNGRARTATVRGAYEGGGTNDGWKLALAIKPLVGGILRPMPPTNLRAE